MRRFVLSCVTSSLLLGLVGCSLTDSGRNLKARTAAFFHTDGADYEQQIDGRRASRRQEDWDESPARLKEIDPESSYKRPWYQDLSNETANDIERNIR